MTKTLEDVKADMSELYESVKAGETDLKTSAELSNITGKFLKAEALIYAREVFDSNRMQQAQLADRRGND